MHLVRHGQGFHNVAGEAEYELYKSWDYEDAHLTETGWQQVRLANKVRSKAGKPSMGHGTCSGTACLAGRVTATRALLIARELKHASWMLRRQPT